jgi:hypothetical protein
LSRRGRGDEAEDAGQNWPEESIQQKRGEPGRLEGIDKRAKKTRISCHRLIPDEDIGRKDAEQEWERHNKAHEWEEG